MPKRKVNLGGQMVDAEEVSFQPDTENGGEQWSHYTLLDGTSLKVKAVLVNAMRIEGMYGPNGDPVYSINSSIVVASSSPESLRKKE